MEYLQYLKNGYVFGDINIGFKPYYKWNTFNTIFLILKMMFLGVLNLIINGIPSIQEADEAPVEVLEVLNLIINGIPSIHNRPKS